MILQQTCGGDNEMSKIILEIEERVRRVATSNGQLRVWVNGDNLDMDRGKKQCRRLTNCGGNRKGTKQ